jgi:hypothetical protein
MRFFRKVVPLRSDAVMFPIPLAFYKARSARTSHIFASSGELPINEYTYKSGHAVGNVY